jgi:hypothetical protein
MHAIRTGVSFFIFVTWPITHKSSLERDIFLRKSYENAPEVAIVDALVLGKIGNLHAVRKFSKLDKPEDPLCLAWGSKEDCLETMIIMAFEYKKTEETEARAQIIFDLATAVSHRRAKGMSNDTVYGATCCRFQFVLYGASWNVRTWQIYNHCH